MVNLGNGWKSLFFSIWTGQQLSMIGSRIARFALVWWVTETTGSATVLATATLVAMLPDILLGPIAGAYIDRHNRQRVMIVADGFVALVSAWLAYLFWIGSMQIWHIYVVMLARSLGSAFHWPAMQASTSLMVPEEHLSRISGLNAAVQGVLSIVAPPLGAMLLAVLPLHGIMLVDVITAAFAIAPLFVVHIPQPECKTAEIRTGSLISDVREGLRYVLAWPGLVAILAMAILLNFVLNPASSLLPILITKTFGGQALELGWANSAWGIGAVVGGVVLSAWGGFRRRIVTTLIGLVGLGIGAIIVGVAPGTLLWTLLLGMFTMGIMNPITNGPLMAIIQARVDPAMQGRVFTVVQAGAAAMSPLGLAIAGPVADALGVQIWFIAGGLLCIAMGIGAVFVPAIMNLEQRGTDAPRPALAVAPELAHAD